MSKVWVQGYDGDKPDTWSLSRVMLGENKILLRGLVRELIKKRYPERLSIWTGPFSAFNDHPNTTADEVLALLEEAIR